jgi:hypothetical protein
MALEGVGHLVDLNDDFFKTLGLSVRAFANFDTDNIAYVEVDVMQQGRDDSGTPQSNVKTFTFTAANCKDPQKWDPKLLKSGSSVSRTYQWRSRVCFKGRDPEPYSNYQNETTRDLNISVATPGKLDVQVIAAGVDFVQTVKLVLVSLTYSDTARGVPLSSQILLLGPDKPSDEWQKMLYAPFDQPVTYQVSYLLQNDQWIKQPSQTTTAQKIIISDPFVDQLNVTLVPAGYWDDAIQSVVTLQYNDAADTYSASQVYNLKSPDEFKQWRVLLRNPALKDFKYQILTTYKSGSVNQGAWVTATGTQAIPVVVQTAPRLKVAVIGVGVDYTQTSIVKVSLRYDDNDNNIHQNTSITLQANHQSDLWNIAIKDGSPTSYRYQITYYPITGQPVEHPEQTSSDAQLIVPHYDVPGAIQVLSRLVDFSVTTAVEVTLHYNDPQRGVSNEQTLEFSDFTPQNWMAGMTDNSPKTYQYDITYYLADGTTAVVPTQTTDKNKLMIPRYRPPTPATPAAPTP